MKTLLIATLLLSFNSYATGIQECSKKVSRAALSLAELEFGKRIEVSELIQETLSTATTFTITIRHQTRPAQLVYEVKTMDLENYRCLIDSIVLK